MAGHAADRSVQSVHPPRPQMQSHHSNSVPSTPFQQPRDLRFHSRSPSPNRGLGNQSPKSVVSEAVGQNSMPRGVPLVCKFETGAEFRKRRIPYVEGGNEELGPPEKEPKKTLEPHEEKKLSGDMRELYDRLLPSAESEERRAKLVQKLERMMTAEWPDADIRVNVFGSSGNLLSSSDSDVDICITTTKQGLDSMHDMAMLLHRNGMEKVVCRASAKVPIVKCWDPELELACDLNVNNPLALENTRMIKTYVQLDDRIRPLAKIIKYWTKRRILNDAAYGGTISSYTWICMIISFLQRRQPPVLPSLQKVEGKRLQSDASSSSSSSSSSTPRFADDVEALRGYGDANKESQAELLFQFFRHYGYEFDYSQYVVSVREGRLVTREEKGWQPSNYHDKEAHKRLCVEEPFTINRNLGNSADDYAWSGVHAEIRRAFGLLADGQQLEKCCEQYEFPPEEKPIFQRPAPTAKPVLRRSASQSGRANHEQPNGRSRKGNNRNQSAQRSSNRRASSGASFGNARMPYTIHSPPVLPQQTIDYFAAQGNLHEELARQYQLLQQKQDVLRAQLHQQSQQGQQTPRMSDMTNSPLHRGGAFTNGMPSPRFLDNPPQTAPLLPLYHYPARYPPPSPLPQVMTRDGTNTNPSSPSLSAALPAHRAQGHRSSVTDGSTGSARSQSQPGRSAHRSLTLPQQIYPGYDMTGAIPVYQALRTVPLQGFAQSIPSASQSPLPPAFPATAPLENAMPKEYMGYYVASPQLGPQYAQQPVGPIQPMTLQNPPQRSRRDTPDLQPPVLNGFHSSRSPSPLGHVRSYSTVDGVRARAERDAWQRPLGYEMPPGPVAAPPQPEPEFAGPLIVNGSTPAVAPPTTEGLNGMPPPPPPPGDEELDGLRVRSSLPLRSSTGPWEAQAQAEGAEMQPSPRISPSPRSKGNSRLNLSPNGTPQAPNGFPEVAREPPQPVTAPLLSPVAELRTPSPTQAYNVFDRQPESPLATANGGLTKTARIANATKQAQRDENQVPAAESKHERKGSAPNPSTPAPSKSPSLPSNPASSAAATSTLPFSGGAATSTSAATNPSQNGWQQVQGGRKGHKKSKSTANAGSGSVKTAGHAIPANETERKGG